jgi:Zn-dependent protease
MSHFHFDPRAFIIGLVVIVCSISLHEFGHAISADRLGDSTPRRDGRITLWPDRHFDPVGFGMMVFTLISGFGLGWGKPVRVNFGAFSKPRRDILIVSAFGPLMNLILAVAAGLAIRVSFATGHAAWLVDPAASGPQSFVTGMPSSIAGQIVEAVLFINLSLMFFNLIPIPPLDGSKILWSVLPGDLADGFSRLMGQFGMILLLVLLFTGMTGKIILPAIETSTEALIGDTQSDVQ